jgi:hypothetical protein
MAIVTRYFSTASAGAGDGTTWADRAALFSAGNWSSVITGFGFAASDSLLCLIGPGTYTCTQTLDNTAITTDPVTDTQLYLHGCDSSGVALEPPDKYWTSADVAFSDSTLPVIDRNTNGITIDQGSTNVRLLKFTGGTSGSTGAIIGNCRTMDWCVVVHTRDNTSSACVAASCRSLTNSWCQVTSAGYQYVIQRSSVGLLTSNVKVIGNSSATTGNRDGVDLGASDRWASFHRVCVYNNPRFGINVTSTDTNQGGIISQCVVANNGSDGIQFSATAAQATTWTVVRNSITGNGAYGIDGQSSRIMLAGNRFRDNTSGNITSLGNAPDTFETYTTDTDDASEYVDTATGDFRIKNTAAIWGMGYGVADEPAASGGGGSRNVIIGG